jgi:hypothetical protein
MILGFVVVRQCSENVTAKENEQQVQARFRQRELEVEAKFQAERDIRLHAESRFDSLLTRYDSIARRDARQTAELKSIKGKFNNLTSKQLEAKMIEEFNNRPK